MIQLPYQNFWYALVLNVSLLPVLLPSVAFGTEQQACDPKNPKHCAIHLEIGSQAPFTGQLLTKDLALDLSLKAESCSDRISFELKYQKALFDLDLQLVNKLRENDLEYCQLQINLLKQRLKESHHTPFYEKPVFVVITTALAVILISYGTAELIEATK